MSSSDRMSVSLCPAAPPTHPARCLRKHRTRTSSPLLYSYPNDIVFDFEPEPVFRGSQASVCSCVPPPTSLTPSTHQPPSPLSRSLCPSHLCLQCSSHAHTCKAAPPVMSTVKNMLSQTPQY